MSFSPLQNVVQKLWHGTPWKDLTDDEKAALVAFLLTLDGEPIDPALGQPPVP